MRARRHGIEGLLCTLTREKVMGREPSAYDMISRLEASGGGPRWLSRLAKERGKKVTIEA